MPRSQTTSVRVEGMKPLLRRLKALPDRVQRKVLRPAVTKAATPVVKAARRLAPTGTGADGRKPLKKAITKTRARLHKPSGTVYVVAGASREAPHAHLVHEGTAPHGIVLGAPLSLGTVVLPAGFVIHHPGAKPNRFLDAAVAATRAQSQAILRKEIGNGIEKQAAILGRQRAA